MGLLGAVLGSQQKVQFIQNQTNTLIQLDASIKEDHTRESSPTEFPIENGNTVSDHVILKPFNLSITGIITDTPIGDTKNLLTEVATTLTSSLLPPLGVVAAGAGFALFKALSNSSSPSVAAYGQLLQLQANAQPFDVLTTLYRYPSMWIKNISAPRDSETGKALIFTVQLTQLILVTPQSVNVQIFANPGLAANKADLGQQGLGIPNGFKKGYDDTTAAIKAVIPGGASH
jgi:hypothetical protein